MTIRPMSDKCRIVAVKQTLGECQMDVRQKSNDSFKWRSDGYKKAPGNWMSNDCC